MRTTRKQVFIMNLIIAGNVDATPIDMDQLIDRLEEEHGWTTSKQSLQFSLRALINHGLIEKRPFALRRGRQRRLFRVTENGKKMFGVSV